MKIIIKLVFVILLFPVAIPQLVFAEDHLTIMSGEWKPFVSADLPENGFTSAVVSHAFLSVGIKTDVEFAPWLRCAAAVKFGKRFATFPYSENKERKEFAYFSDALARSRTVFFYSREKTRSFRYSGLDSLKNFLIGGIRGYFYVPELKRSGLSIDYSENESDAFKKLLVGRVDLVLVNELVGWKIINSSFADHRKSFAICDSAFSVNELRLMVSKKYKNSENLLRLFNRGLKTIKTDGTYRDILKRHKIPEPVGSYEFR